MTEKQIPAIGTVLTLSRDVKNGNGYRAAKGSKVEVVGHYEPWQDVPGFIVKAPEVKTGYKFVIGLDETCVEPWAETK